MAVNNACALTLEEWKAGADFDAGDADYWRKVWTHASAILRISAVLEKGKLAPNEARQEQEAGPEPAPAEEAPPPQPPANPPARRNQPTASGQAFDGPENNEDVPF